MTNEQAELSGINLLKPLNYHNIADQPRNAKHGTTYLNKSYWLKHKTSGFFSLFGIFTSLSILIGIIIICLTSPKSIETKCNFNLKLMEYKLAEYMCGPRSVAVGDLNNDTILDLVVVQQKVDKITVYFGVGDGTFTNRIDYSTGLHSRPYAVEIADFNRDSQMDIIIANFDSNNIVIMYGLGNRSFSQYTELLSTNASRPIEIITADFNKDSYPDIAIANYGTDSISVYYHHLDAPLLITYSTDYDSHPIALVAEDFDNDNHLDLAIVNYGTNEIRILFGTSNQYFDDKITISTGVNSQPRSIAVGYFNADEFIDLVVSNSGTNQISIFLNNGNRTFVYHVSYSTDSGSPYAIGVGDFNQDNLPDIIVTNKGTTNIILFLGHGNGDFEVSTMLQTGSSSSIALGIGQLNSDRRLDIVVVNEDTETIDIVIGEYGGFANQTRYPTGLNPQFITAADFNDDTVTDIIIANADSNVVSIHLGQGDGSFGLPTNYSVGSGPQSIVIDDFNNDGRSDIVVCNYWSNDVSILLGQANGSFAEKLRYSVGMNPRSIGAGDFNNDDQLDIAVVNVNTQDVSILLGQGNGSFLKQATYSVGSSPQYLVVGDFNGDTWLDIVTTNSLDNTISLLLGIGDGSFKQQMTYKVGLSPYYAAVADFNNDNQSDIIVANYGSNDVIVLFGTDNGLVPQSGRYRAGSGPISIGINDFNNDTQLDIAIVNSMSNDIIIFLGIDNGPFIPESRVTFPVGSLPSSIVTGDFNNDTRVDIIVVNANDSDISVLLQYNTGTMSVSNTYAAGVGSRLACILTGDLNNDTNLDILVVNYGTNNIGVFYGYGNSSFTEQAVFYAASNTHPLLIAFGNFSNDNSIDIAIATEGTKQLTILNSNTILNLFLREWTGDNSFQSEPLAMISSDFNNDGQSEVILVYDDEDYVDIFVSNDPAIFLVPILYSISFNITSVAVGDFNHDDQLDAVIADSDNNCVRILFGKGDGSFIQETQYPVGDYPQFVIVGDFNNDSRVDIVAVNKWSDDISILLNLGNGSFAQQIRYLTGSGPCYAAIDDFNDDNQLDIVVVNSLSNDISIFLGLGNGSFTQQTNYSSGSYPSSVAVGDFNKDTQVDIVITNYLDNEISILFGVGNGSFAQQTTYPVELSPQAVAIGDFNNDTLLDIAVLNSGSSTVSILIGRDNGLFSQQMTHVVGSYPLSFAIDDLNKDNQLDIVIVNHWNDDISVLLGQGNGSFVDGSLYPVGFFPQSIALGDFNNDDRLDMIVVNFFGNGVNVLAGFAINTFQKKATLSAGPNSKPKSFAIGDFNNDGTMDLVTANLNSNSIGLFLGFGNISFAEQIVLAKESSLSPCSMAAGDVNNDTLLDIVFTNCYSDFISILFQIDNGSFGNLTSYSIGLYSAHRSLLLNDINNDTYLDIIITNRDSNNIGVFLGYGNGLFSSMLSFQLEYGSRPVSAIIGDFNNDHKLDMAVLNNGTDSLNIFLRTC